ncbi:MAG: GGDEF domain-containing protein [Lachnospiraceae bacterium]|nr:GGDEF domain-containing protein [Lachnospiraceae bacterium]
MKKRFPGVSERTKVRFDKLTSGPGSVFMKAVSQCGKDGRRAFFNESLEDGTMVQLMVRRIAINPITGVKAFAVVILGIGDKDAQTGLTYNSVARALSVDYINLYYVNIKNDRFIEYSSDSADGNLVVERHGEDFFNASKQDAQIYIFEDDREAFLESFVKTRIIKAIDEHEAFTMTYRLLIRDVPVYVNMKVVRTDKDHILIGVNNVDAQMKHQETLERVKEERITYSRITALSGDFIAIYTVDPETDHYIEYSATRDYEGLGLAKEGEDFFKESRREGARTIFLEDLDMFQSTFVKENVIKQIEKNGLFIMNYRLVLDGEPNYVCLKAAMIQEKDGPQLIVGVTNIDAQVKRDQEYARNLSMARIKANIDELTGVRNKHAYVDAESQLNLLIDEGRIPPFAIIVCDVNGLKEVNDTKGHQAGDVFLQQGCEMICNIFLHSPVFRVGGDEFAVVAQGRDYKNLDALFARLEEKNQEHLAAGEVVVAAGMARYDRERSVAAVFERADSLMYENKRRLKA